MCLYAVYTHRQYSDEMPSTSWALYSLDTHKCPHHVLAKTLSVMSNFPSSLNESPGFMKRERTPKENIEMNNNMNGSIGNGCDALFCGAESRAQWNF